MKSQGGKNMKKLISVLICFVFCLCLFGCGEEPVKAPVFEVSGEKVFEGEFNFYLETAKTQIEAEIGSDIDWEKDKLSGVLILDIAKENARKNVIKYKVLKKEAIRLGLLIDNKKAEETKKSVTDVFSQDELKSMGIDDKVLEVIVSDILYEKMLYEHYKKDESILNVTEEQMRAKFDYNLSTGDETYTDFDDENTREALYNSIVEERIKAKYEELVLLAEVK